MFKVGDTVILNNPYYGTNWRYGGGRDIAFGKKAEVTGIYPNGKICVRLEREAGAYTYWYVTAVEISLVEGTTAPAPASRVYQSKRLKFEVRG